MNRKVLRSAVLVFGLALGACASSESEPPNENVVDHVAGPLVVTSPARASFLHTTEAVVVRGTGATKALRVNGMPAKVADDGTFEATFEPIRGLNLVVAVDGESSVEVPFIWGEYASPDKPVAHAVTFDLGPQGFHAQDPQASLSTLATGALTARNLAESLVGMSTSGSALGIDYSYEVTGASYGAADVRLAPADGGPNVTVTVTNLVVDGTMTLDGDPKAVQITASSATVSGIVKLTLDAEGKLAASMPDASVTLDGFQFDSGNILLDFAISAILKGQVEKEILKAIKEEVPTALSGAFDGIALPTELDLSAVGVPTPVPIASKYDAVVFDLGGGTLSLQALFGTPPAPGSPGAAAPGSLVLGGNYAVGKNRPSSIGLSLSLDAVNQLLFAAWGTGTVSFKAASMNLSPKLPPLAMLDDQGALTLALGEILVQQEGATEPMAAVTVLQRVQGAAEPEALVLTPNGDPHISITWLSGSAGPARDLIATAAREQLKKALEPIRIPIPKIPLDGLSPSFAGQSLVIANTNVTIAQSAARVSAAGVMTIVK